MTLAIEELGTYNELEILYPDKRGNRVLPDSSLLDEAIINPSDKESNTYALLAIAEALTVTATLAEARNQMTARALAISERHLEMAEEHIKMAGAAHEREVLRAAKEDERDATNREILAKLDVVQEVLSTIEPFIDEAVTKKVAFALRKALA